jgi:hypothetical protein
VINLAADRHCVAAAQTRSEPKVVTASAAPLANHVLANLQIVKAGRALFERSTDARVVGDGTRGASFETVALI